MAGWLETHATCSYLQRDSACAECASWLLLIPFWLAANYILMRTSHFSSLSSSIELPTCFCYHRHFTSTPPNHGSTYTSTRCEWISIKQNKAHIIQHATCWDPTTTQTAHSPPWCCKCRHWNHDPGHIVTKLCVKLEVARRRSRTQSDVSIVVSRKTVVN